jgi:hypothetical protein
MATFGQHLFAVSHSFRTALSTSPDHQQRLSKPLVKQGRAVSQRGYSVAQRTTMQFSGLALRFARPDVKCDLISVSKLRLQNSYGDNSCQFVNLGHLSSRVWSFRLSSPWNILEPFQVAKVDGDHSTEGTLADLENFRKLASCRCSTMFKESPDSDCDQY